MYIGIVVDTACGPSWAGSTGYEDRNVEGTAQRRARAVEACTTPNRPHVTAARTSIATSCKRWSNRNIHWPADFFSNDPGLTGYLVVCSMARHQPHRAQDRHDQATGGINDSTTTSPSTRPGRMPSGSSTSITSLRTNLRNATSGYSFARAEPRRDTTGWMELRAAAGKRFGTIAGRGAEGRWSLLGDCYRLYVEYLFSSGNR